MASTSGIKQIATQLDGIGHILADLRIEIPRYQRSYAWEERQVRDFYEDLEQAMTEKLDEYFLGSIVLIHKREESELPQLVDGQQRLATTTILLAAIRDYLHGIGETDRADIISSTYLFMRNLRTEEVIPRLVLNQVDNDYFVKRILSKPDSQDRSTPPTKDSHKRLEHASHLAKEHVITLAKDQNKKIDTVLDLVDYLVEKVVVIKVEVPDHANAFRIFETLNDRGLELAISDLLKNYLFHMSANRIEEVQQRWISMLGTLESVGQEELGVQYIRHLWSAKHGATRERDLYDSIKEGIKTKQDAVDFASELAENAIIYSAIINTESEVWNKYGTTAQHHMATLNLLGMIQIRPLILAVLDNFSVTEAKKALKIFVSWAVRFIIVGGLGGGTLDNHYSQRAKEINEEKITNTAKLIQAMKGIVPTDTEFEASFSSATISKPVLARYYLRSLELQNSGKPDPAFVPNANEEQVNLEHILPQSFAGTSWSQAIDPDTAKANYRRLGNLVLLKSKINSSIGSMDFSGKKVVYSKSEFELTKQVAAYNEWTPIEIQTRQKELAKLATQTWPNK